MTAEKKAVESRSFVATRIHQRGTVTVYQCEDGHFQAGSQLSGAERITWIGVRSADLVAVKSVVEKEFSDPQSGRRWAGDWKAV